MSWADNRGNYMKVVLEASGTTVPLCEHSKADPTERKIVGKNPTIFS